jgi:hypothetical protein
LTDEQRRVYLLLREGCAQSLAAKRTGLLKGTVCKIARKLSREGFLERVTDVRPYLYGAGPRSKELDRLIVARKVSTSTPSEVSTNATSVKQVSPETSHVRTVRTHHVKVRFKVEKIGDMEQLSTKDGDLDFLEKGPYYDYRSVKRTKGRLHHPGGVCSVELEEGPSKTWFYIHLPEREMTSEEVPGWEERYSKLAQDAANFIQKWGGWKFGLMEFCNRWKPHFSTEDPRILQQIVGKVTAANHDRSTWLSDSEDRRELETSDPEYAQIIVSIPEALYELKLEMKDLVEITSLIKTAVENLTRAEALELEDRAAGEGLGIGK